MVEPEYGVAPTTEAQVETSSINPEATYSSAPRLDDDKRPGEFCGFDRGKRSYEQLVAAGGGNVVGNTDDDDAAVSTQRIPEDVGEAGVRRDECQRLVLGIGEDIRVAVAAQPHVPHVRGRKTRLP